MSPLRLALRLPGQPARIAVAAGLAALTYWVMPPPSRPRLVVYAKVTTLQTWTARYETGNGHAAGSSTRVSVEGSEDVQTLRFPLPQGAARVRLELGGGSGVTELRRICVRHDAGERCHRRAELHAGLRPLRGVESLRLVPRGVAVVSSGAEPSVEYDLKALLPRVGLTRLAALLVALLVPWSPALLRWADHTASKLAPALHWAIERRFALALALFSLLVGLRLHGSSLALWDEALGDKTRGYERPLLLGAPRSIVSDEWAIQTPLHLGQRLVKRSFFPVINPNARLSGQNVLVHHVGPALDPTIVARPFQWGYLLFDNDRGLAWWWWSRLLLLFLLSYEMAVLLTGSSGLLPLLAGACVAFSPGVQWSYSLCHTDLIIAWEAMVVCAWGYTRAASVVRRALLAVGFVIAVVGFGMTIYPPYQVPLGYLALALLILFVTQQRVWQRLEWRDWAVLALLAAGAALVALAFLLESLGSLRLLASTVFPGSRRAPGGDLPVFELQQYLISWLLPFVDPPYSNPAELSGFIHLLPAVLLSLPWTLRREHGQRGFILTLLAFTMAALAWMIVPLPRWLGAWTLLDRVPPDRLQPIFELVALYLTVWALGIASREGGPRPRVALGIASIVASVELASIQLSPMKPYLGAPSTLAVIGFFFWLNVFLVKGQRRPFAAMMLAYVVVSGGPVNPLARGTSPLYEKTVVRRAQAVAARDPDALWAARGRGTYGNLLIASGIHSVNGTHCYPDFELWRRLDPEGRFVNVYNRYATVGLEIIDGNTEVRLGQDPGVVVLRANLRDLTSLGVRYLLSVGAVKLNDMRGLRTLHHDTVDEILIYEIVGPG